MCGLDSSAEGKSTIDNERSIGELITGKGFEYELIAGTILKDEQITYE